jgi:hypothetical protein
MCKVVECRETRGNVEDVEDVEDVDSVKLSKAYATGSGMVGV